MLTQTYKTRLIIGAMLMAALLLGCSDSDDSNNSGQAQPAAANDIVDTAIAAGNFTTLVAALQAAGLVDVFRGPGPFTVFAPTDTAFTAIPAATLNDLLNDPNKAPLNDILKYHVFGGEVLAGQAVALAGQNVAMVNGDLLALDTQGSDLILNLGASSPATVTATDIRASNGVVHVIDTVLAPADGKSNIFDKLDNLGNFTSLIDAVQTAGLAGTLSGPGTFTLFAPTDGAFANIPAATLNALLADIPALTDVLTYHVLAAEIFAVDAIAASGTRVNAVNGGNIGVDVVGADELFLNLAGGSTAGVTITDFIATNGNVHVIDTVLDPNDTVP